MIHTTMLGLVVMAIFLQGFTSRPTETTVNTEDPEQVRSEALKRLLKVFGIEDPPHSLHHAKQPPQYMIDLYNTVADADGVTKDPDLLEGNTVRSFFDKGKACFHLKCPFIMSVYHLVYYYTILLLQLLAP